jgi:type VI secretion system protein ImpF
MPDLTGKATSTIKTAQLEKTLKQVILRFEPRIIPKTLRITLHEDDTTTDQNALIFKISGDLWAEPVPIHLQLMTQLDLDSGTVEVNDLP